MADTFRFRAFISYSHRDDKWAKWLHGALESYRLPKNLVGTPGALGPVPHTFAPVFRDRDELPTSPDLSEQVREALGEAGALIVVCSPAASASKWVNEEIRRFRALGRADRIFCLIVDGDPEAENAAERCFPPALFEGDDGQRHEPLAADARKFGDGKSLAKLKLVAGILGVRLDALRQREVQRRRRTRLLASVAGIAAVTLAVIAVSSRFAEQRQRESSEQLAGFVVQLGEDLESVASVETLGRIGARMYEYLGSLDERLLTPETRRQVALVLRQLGEVNRLQGRNVEALVALVRSLETFEDLAARQPGDTGLLYELGNAEFYVGNVFYETGDYAAALPYFRRYQGVANQLVQREPDNPAWIMELASAHTNLAGLKALADVGERQAMVTHIGDALALMEEAMALAPEEDTYRSLYTSTLSWSAETHTGVCELRAAADRRAEVVALTRESLSGQPSDRTVRRDLAFALTGLGDAQHQLGLVDEAMSSFVAARRELDELSAFDPGNLSFRWEALYRAALVGDLRMELGEAAVSRAELAELRAPMEALRNSEGFDSTRVDSEFADYLMFLAKAAWRDGDEAMARAVMAEALPLLEGVVRDKPEDRTSMTRLFRLRYLAWEMGVESAEEVLSVGDALSPEVGETGASCERADIAVRRAILKEDRDAAGQWARYLADRGYAEPDYVRFCRSQGLCGP